ncbi:Phospholipid-lipopolysaccharide ABC transporter [Prochlorococcus marinus str. MIT 9321]|nr:Phospholipid-lipopolysaccharide ABC transporter [Prochlorococcus marinus str. MIT 9321]KGG05497.1 Phospholipid-lipopolysaccharide ABC transporter [Prochlorococcus marinus str. MIT 9322]
MNMALKNNFLDVFLSFNLWKYISNKRKRQLGFLSILIIISGISEIFTLTSIAPFLEILANPQSKIENNILRNIYDLQFSFLSLDKLTFMLIVFLLFLTLSALIRLLILYLNDFISALIGNELGVKTFSSFLYRPYEFHLENNTSKMISLIVTKIDSAIDSIRSIINIICSAIILISIFTTLIGINIFITTATLASILLFYLLLALILRKRLGVISKKRSFLIRSQTQSIQEGLGFIRDIIIDNCQNYFLKIFTFNDRSLRIIDARSYFIAGSPKYILEVLGIIFLLVTSILYKENIGNELSIIPLLGSIAFGMQRILPVIQQIYSSFVILSTNKDSILDLVEILKHTGKSQEFINASSRKILKFEEEISLEKISFKYSNNPKYIIENLNLNIKKGSVLGIIGKSGSGKSTLIDIIMGLIKPQKGSVKVDGVELLFGENGNTKQWFPRISHVPQEIFISDNSIQENIAFGINKDSIDNAQLLKAIKNSQLDSLIRNTKYGLNMYVGERGALLSGGQKQRIGFARALYKGGDLLILDEFTSALDVKTEESLIETIKNLKRQVTIIIVSHKKSLLGFCDEIIELESNC